MTTTAPDPTYAALVRRNRQLDATLAALGYPRCTCHPADDDSEHCLPTPEAWLLAHDLTLIEQTARALHAWDVEGGPCEGPWESLTPEQHEVWLSGARALADAGLLTITSRRHRGDVIGQVARMLHTLQWDGEQEEAESAWDHYPILAVARQEYLRTAEALADAGLLAGSRTVTPEQREAAEAVLMTSPHMLLLSPGTIAKIVDTVLTAVGLTVEEDGRG